jgi:hypothetical protein
MYGVSTLQTMPTMMLGANQHKCDVLWHLHDLLEHTAENDGLDLQSSSGELAHKRVADRSDRQLIRQRPTQHDAARSQGSLRLVGLWYEAQES